MDETYTPDSPIDETRAAHQKPEQDRTTADILLIMINERESLLRNLSNPDSWSAMAFEQAGTRQQAVDIVRQEIEALRKLDPVTATEEQVRETSRTYHDQLNNLQPRD